VEDRSPDTDRPILILLSDAPELPARVRSETHEVRYWIDGATEASGAAGDPTVATSYAWTRDARSVTAIIDLESADRARAALRALRTVRPDAAVLILTADAADVDGNHDGTLARSGELRDVVRLDLDEEVSRLEAERRAYCLRRFAENAEVVPILIHDDPDPDAVSSALGVVALLGGSHDRTPIVTLDEIRRPENRRMVDLLHIRVTRVTADELRQFSHVIAVDMQPSGLRHEGRPQLAVIDHHPHNDQDAAEFIDVRPTYGATATMLTEYLRAVMQERVRGSLATALLFGIKTDTASLTRGVSPADVEAYAFLQQHADLQQVRRFEQPSYQAATARAFGHALASAHCEDGICAAYLGELSEDTAHVQTELADFCLAIDDITWVVVGAIVEENVVLTLRHASGVGPGAGAVARALAGDVGSGGGHAIMARVTVPASSADRVLGGTAEGDEAAALHSLLRRTIEEVSKVEQPVGD
jgi:nanoRNase/pAp phosphatase (c-di-AMP/oligoRNAs hydrolase)